MDLKELLGEELYNQVIEKAGDKKIAVVSDGNWFPKEKFDTVNNENKSLKQQVKDRDKQLNDLKGVDPEKLQQKITDLQQANKDKDKEHREQTAKQQKEFAIELALRDANALNTKAVKALLDTDSIKLDGETLLGLDDQLKTLQESDAYLFKQEQKPNSPTIVAGGNPNGGGSGAITKEQIMKEPDAIKRQKMIQENSQLFQ
ncbi:phage scaffolding protein [Oceanobacillus alkalisoli]|uniref:phage scaffolding protein n=1 Tax=Oceanobacillus alkalisoli TaxID=2925113 RepID=UPI001EE4D724|nr:phage scaffolding protein [Oceanobacillus alkalisoli]MCG5104443.1 phage scaffolding protein [Oceanobacillus alkalisoli]